MTKFKRTLKPQQKLPPTNTKVSLHGADKGKTAVWGADSLSTYIDVLSVGPIGEIKETYYNDTNLNREEFPNTKTFEHDGSVATVPWTEYPYVERTFVIGKTADAIDNEDFATLTDLTREVSEVGVKAIRVTFNTSAFNQKDNKGRRKKAVASFYLHAYDEDGEIIYRDNGTALTAFAVHQYYCQSSTSVSVTLEVPDSFMSQVWGYKVEMKVRGRLHDVPVSGSWSCALVTEIYKDTQTYKDVAFVSGEIVSSDVSGKIPKRTYLVDGYKVAVPQLNTQQKHNGLFVAQTSDSHAWNILAVLTDSKWGGDLPLDKINLDSFIRFEAYCSELVDGKRRYTFSYYLTKATNFFRLAHLMAGSADAKLAEDENGRIGIMIDQQKSARRIITSYDIVGEKVKRTTTNNNKRVNYVSGQFDDASNGHEKTIIHVEDSQAITDHGLIQKKLVLNACTNRDEAERSIQRLLSTSQFVSESYALKVGPSHADVVIGEIISVYDRRHSRVDYCGKFAEGSTTTVLNIDPRTPIDVTSLTGTMSVSFQLETKDATGAYEHVTAQIASVGTNSITLTTALSSIPEAFTSFGISTADLQPTLMKVLGLTNSKGVIGLEAVAYNDSLYDFVDGVTNEITKPNTRILPDHTALAIDSLVVTNQGSSGVKATWNGTAPTGYIFVWYKGVGSDREQLTAPVNTTQLEATYNTDIELDTYTVSVYARGLGTTGLVYEAAVNLATVVLTQTSSIALPTNFGDSGGDYGSFLGRGTSLTWDYVDHADHAGFRLEVSTTSGNFFVSLPTHARTFDVLESRMIQEFGTAGYPRQIEAKITAIDKDLNGSTTVTRVINNLPIPAPTITTDSDGNVTLSSATALSDDYESAYVYVWKTSDGESSAIYVEVTDVEANGTVSLLVPFGTIERDTSLEQTNYSFKAGIVDSFGQVGTLETTLTKDFGRYTDIPDPVELIRVAALTETSARIYLEHSGDHLNTIQVYAKLSSSVGGWISWGTEEIIKPLSTQTQSTKGSFANGEGFIEVTGLAFNSEYVFATQVKNANSVYSENSNEVSGSPLIDVVDTVDVVDIIESFNFMDEASATEIIDDLNFGMDPRSLFVEGVSDAFETVKNKLGVIEEIRKRETADLSMIETINQIQVEFQGLDTVTNARITDIELVRTTSESALAQSITDLGVAVGSDISTSATSLTTAFANADTALGERIDTLTSTVGGNTSDITSTNTAFATADTALGQRIDTLTSTVGVNTSAITSTNSAFATADTALAQRIDTIEVTAGGNTSAIVSNASVSADADTALGQRIDTLTSTVGDNTAAISTNFSTLTNADTAIAQSVTALTTTVSGNTSTISTNLNSQTTADSALGVRIDNLSSTVGDNSSAIITTNTAFANADTALGQRIDTLTSTVGGNSSTISNNFTTLSNADTAIAQTLTNLATVVGSNTSTMSTLSTTSADADTALSQRIDSLTSTVSGNSSTIINNMST